MKSIVFTVTNDLNYDQRMDRICTSLCKVYAVTLVGRQRASSTPLKDKPYEQVRLKCWFDKGKLFYAEYNIRLYFYLVRQRFDIYCAIDLDTILPVFRVARKRRKPMVYDAHEYFTEMEEVVTRPVIRKIWNRIERMTVPEIRNSYTISEGYANLFKEKYGTGFEVIRNLPRLADYHSPDKKDTYVLYQGAVNLGRGLPELVKAMEMVNCELHICGRGDIHNKLVTLSKELNIEDKIKFWGYIAPEKLIKHTVEATVGVTLFSDTGLHHRHSLANRFFDYTHCGIPQIAMKYPEYLRFNDEFEVAILIDDLRIETIATAINELLNNKDLYYKLKTNCLQAREVHNWQNEEKKLLSFYEGLS